MEKAQWMKDIRAKKPAPANTAPGIIYMLCGAAQHSNTDQKDLYGFTSVTSRLT